MIPINTELYSSPYYFYLKDKGKYCDLYFSSESTLSEARKKDEKIRISKDKLSDLKKLLLNLLKTKKKKSTSELKSELEELVTSDGSMASSKIPILDPRMHPKKTMDQTVPAARITNDPVSRGYRVYYGESIEEEDLSKAFGYEETSGKTPQTTIKILDKMGVDNQIERAEEFGKDIKLNKKKKKGSDMRIRLTEKEKLEEIQRKKMMKMVEDMLMNKKTSTKDISKKSEENEHVAIIKKNINSIVRQAERSGLSRKDVMRMLKDE